jgi:hypothetical protein
MNTDISNTSTNVNKMNKIRCSLYNRSQRSRGGVDVPVYFFFNLCSGRGELSTSRPGRFKTGKRKHVHIEEEAVWAPGPVWTGAENIAHTGILSPDSPACSESPHRLRYPNPPKD